MSKGRVTIPTEDNFLKETIEILNKWKADAVRNCDGTNMPKEIIELGQKVYQTYFVARGDNEFAKHHKDEFQQIFLMSDEITAESNEVIIFPLNGYFKQQISIDTIHDCKKYWQVFDRTTNEEVDLNDWNFDKKTQCVTVKNAIKFHTYTVNFLAYVIWDQTQMYNYITNNWTKEKDLPLDSRQKNAYDRLCVRLENWLKENKDTNVVRFTTFFYHFTLIFNEKSKEKYVDWFGYGSSVSVKALEDFEKLYGYRLSSEDFVDQGYYNSSFRVPTKHYLDYIDFIQQFVSDTCKKLVELVHRYKKEAMMFLGDNWIGTEPYGKYFKDIQLDAVVGSVGSGATLRMISDIPGVKYTEGRFLPYFFPDTFYEGNDPTIEAKENWRVARRAIMRKPVDRIGYGGYLSLAYKFPKFVNYIEHVCNEFREIYDCIDNKKPFSNVKVAILNSYGKLRTWQTHMVAHALWYKEIYTYQGVIEALSGMAVDVDFISFDDVINSNCLKNYDVVINCGSQMTSFSGGEYWKNPKLIEKIKEFVFDGKGFIGIGEPASIHYGGKFFQLKDILGVDKELGFSLSTDKYFNSQIKKHFIVEDAKLGKINYGEEIDSIFATSKDTLLADYHNNQVYISSHDFGKGRGVYINGLPYDSQNTRILLRSIFYACKKEDLMFEYFSSNPEVECSYYPSTNKLAVVNNSYAAQHTKVHFNKNDFVEIDLEPLQIIWLKGEKYE